MSFLNSSQQRSHKNWVLGAGVTATLFLVFSFYNYQHLRVTKAQTFRSNVFNSTLGFGDIFVINLPSRTDHKDALTLAGAVTGLRFEFIEGVRGDVVSDKALPTDANRESLGIGNVGSWRAHMNALTTIVSKNLSAALILEDDVDWDIRIKSQLSDFAEGSRALTQPLLTGGYNDPTLESRDLLPSSTTPVGEDLSLASLEQTIPPQLSPYGDNWDVLWLGHCGVQFPNPDQHIPKGRYTILNDDTVPGWQHRHALTSRVRDEYPEHTRVIHHAMGPICTFAYAVSQRGARKILLELGVNSFNGPFDNMMAGFCDRHTCITSQPQYFNHWRAAGSPDKDSDITHWGDGDYRERGFSDNIRLSTRHNLDALVNGRGVQDQLPD